MDAAIVQAQHEPAREVVRDVRGVEIGVIERQRQTGKLVGRNKHGIVIGNFDGSVTRNARGQIIARANMLPALLLLGR